MLTEQQIRDLNNHNLLTGESLNQDQWMQKLSDFAQVKATPEWQNSTNAARANLGVSPLSQAEINYGSSGAARPTTSQPPTLSFGRGGGSYQNQQQGFNQVSPYQQNYSQQSAYQNPYQNPYGSGQNQSFNQGYWGRPQAYSPYQQSGGAGYSNSYQGMNGAMGYGMNQGRSPYSRGGK